MDLLPSYLRRAQTQAFDPTIKNILSAIWTQDAIDELTDLITNLENINVKQTIWEEITAKGIDDTVDNFNGKTSVDTTVWDSSPYNSEAKKVDAGGSYTGEDIFTASGTHIKSIIDANGDYLLSGIPNPALYPRYSIVYVRKGTVKEFGEEEIPSSQILKVEETPPMIRDVDNAEVRPKNDGDNINPKSGGFLDDIRDTDVLYVNRIEEKKQQYITVAKDGGDFTTIQDAVDSITDASVNKRYTIKIFPGIYIEDIINKNFIDFEGTNVRNTIIQGNLTLGANFHGGNFSYNKTITSTETLIDASTSGGIIEFLNCAINVVVSGQDVAPTLIDINTSIFIFNTSTISYTRTDGETITNDTNLINLQGNGDYIFINSGFALNSNAESGNINFINDNNSGITRTAFSDIAINISNALWNDKITFINQINNSSNRHAILSSDVNIKNTSGSDLGICHALNNDSGGALSSVESGAIRVNGFNENCVANAENVGDIIDFTFCTKNEETSDTEAFCGNGLIKRVYRNNGEFIVNTDIIDLGTLIGAPTNNSLQDMFNIGFNAGWVSGQEVSDNLDGTVDIALGTGYVRTFDDEQAPLKSFDIIAFENVALVDQAENYVYVDYNSGNPIVLVTQTGSTILDNENDKYELYEIFREGTDLHITDHRQRAKNVGSRVQQRIYSINKIERANSVGGLIISESADNNRNVLMSAGFLWVKLNPIPIEAIDTSGADTFDRYYLTGGTTWNKTTGNTTWDNINYNDTTTGIVEMVVNRYSFQDFWLDADNELVSVYGNAQYVSLAGASDAPVSIAPPRTDDHAIYIGRIVFRKSDTIAQVVLTAFGSTLFGGSSTNSHPLLSGLTWLGSGHSGNPNKLAGFDGAGVATEYDINPFDQDLNTTDSPEFAGLDVDDITINDNKIKNSVLGGEIELTENVLLTPNSGYIANLPQARGDYFFIGTPVGSPATDQSQLLTNANIAQTNAWQSFTTGLVASFLTSIDIRNVSTVNSVILFIYEGEGTGGTLLSKTTIGNIGSGVQTLTIEKPVFLKASTQYTWAITNSANNSLQFQTGNPYAGGRSSVDANYDFYFLTRMDVGSFFSYDTTNQIFEIVGDIVVSGNVDGVDIASLSSDVSDNTTEIGLKADDNAVVHLTGIETISGAKTFTNNTFIVGDDSTDEDKSLTIKSKQSVILTLEADTDDTTESHNPKIVMSQDGGNTTAEIGLRESGDDLFIRHNLATGDIRLQTNGANDRFTISSSGAIFAPDVYSRNVSGRGTQVSPAGLLGTLLSIREGKTNIEDFDSDFVHQLKPKMFNYRLKDENGNFTNEHEERKEWGLIAEDIEALLPEYPELVHFLDYDVLEDGSKKLASIFRRALPFMLLNEIKKLKIRIEELENV